MPDKKWYYQHDGQIDGPFSESDLLTMINWGTLPQSTHLVSEDGGEWRPISEVFPLAAQGGAPSQAAASGPATILSKKPLKKQKRAKGESPRRPTRQGKVKFYAGFIRRALAWLVDGLIESVAFFLGCFLFLPYSPILALIMLIALCFYEIGFTASYWQATPGKRFMGLRVMTVQEGDIGIFRSIWRFLSKVVIVPMVVRLLVWVTLHIAHLPVRMEEELKLLMPLGLFLIAYGMAACTPRKRALHDYIAGTIVVYD